MSASDGARFEGTELCSETFDLSRVGDGCGSAFFPSPRQASSWRWRRLPPRGDASPPWARGPPPSRDPGSPRPGIRRRLPTRKRRPRVISARRKLRADFLPRGAAAPPSSGGRAWRSSAKPRGREDGRARTRGRGLVVGGALPTHVGASDPRVLARLPPAATQPPAAGQCSRPPALGQALSRPQTFQIEHETQPISSNGAYLLESHAAILTRADLRVKNLDFGIR